MPKMSTIAICLFTLFCFGASVVWANSAGPKPLDLMLVVEAIRQVENSPIRAVGRGGERSEWQIGPSVWREYSSKPLWWASSVKREHRQEQHRVALALVTWIHDNLHCIPLSDTAYSIGLVYTCGYKTVKHSMPTQAKFGYAQRVQNVYDQLTKE